MTKKNVLSTYSSMNILVIFFVVFLYLLNFTECELEILYKKNSKRKNTIRKHYYCNFDSIRLPGFRLSFNGKILFAEHIKSTWKNTVGVERIIKKGKGKGKECYKLEKKKRQKGNTKLQKNKIIIILIF